MSAREILLELQALHAPHDSAGRDTRIAIVDGDQPDDHECVEDCDPGAFHAVLACFDCTDETGQVGRAWPCPSARRVEDALAELDAPTRQLVALSRWIDDNAMGKDPTLQLWGRCGKVAEEAGEVAAAVIGILGQNPRKGITHDRPLLMGELLDVAVTALGAVEHITGNQGYAFDALAQHLAHVLKRAGVSA